MKNIFVLLMFCSVLNCMELPVKTVCYEISAHVGYDLVPRMEMGMVSPACQPRSDSQACCDCILDPDLYVSIGLQTLPLIYLVDKVWETVDQTHQTAFLPMVYASAMALNGASIAKTMWHKFRDSKFKTVKQKQD